MFQNICQAKILTLIMIGAKMFGGKKIEKSYKIAVSSRI